MNDLTICLTPEEEIQVENKLRELYVLQDKPIKKGLFPIILNEVISSGKPFGAIIAGLNDLKTEDLKKISYPIIMEAVFNHCEKDLEPKPCGDCLGGFIVMRDDQGINFSLACICKAGDRIYKQGNARWNGQSMQSSKGQTLTRP